jgi:hypothetical protein
MGRVEDEKVEPARLPREEAGGAAEEIGVGGDLRRLASAAITFG